MKIKTHGSDETDHVCADEQEIRERIAQEIRQIDISEAKQISSDWYAASRRMLMVCESIARGNSE